MQTNEYKIRFSIIHNGERSTLYEIMNTESREQAVQLLSCGMYATRHGFRVEKVWIRRGYSWEVC